MIPRFLVTTTRFRLRTSLNGKTSDKIRRSSQAVLEPLKSERPGRLILFGGDGSVCRPLGVRLACKILGRGSRIHPPNRGSILLGENFVPHPENTVQPPAVHSAWTRRRFLRKTAVLTGSPLAWSSVGRNPAIGADDNPRRPRVAALFSHFTAGSHSELILESFLEPYVFNGQHHTSPCDVVSFYIDKFPRSEDGDAAERIVGTGTDDIGRDVAKNYGIPLYSTIAEALCLGTSGLAVDAVLSIGEYGYRPISALSDREFPRRRFLNEIVAVMRRSNRVVPVFNDKNFTYRWDWGKEMFDTARQAGIPLMAGSSVPLAERRPALELPLGSPIEELVTVHGGSLEGYDYHGIELLQSLAEGRLFESDLARHEGPATCRRCRVDSSRRRTVVRASGRSGPRSRFFHAAARHP